MIEAFKGRFNFGDIVTVDCDGYRYVGVVVKIWENVRKEKFTYDVYIRSWNSIREFEENDLQRIIYDKEVEIQS